MAEETIYNSIHTGEQIDSAVAWLLKHAQDHICGGAAPGTTIETPIDPTYWFAGAGTYTCGGSETITIPEANIGIISYDGSEWSSSNFNVGSNQAIKNNLLILLESLGNYCFPDGKPTFDWDDDTPVVIQYDVEKHLTNLSSNAPSKVNYGSELVIQLTTPSNLYVIDEDTVQVTMGSVELSGAFDPSTGKITINRVTGKVVIYATAITYVGYGEQNSPLVAMFDGKNVDSANNQWVDMMDNTRILQLSGCTVNSDNVEFDGSDDTCHASSTNVGIDVLALSGTVESVVSNLGLSATGKYSYPLMNKKYSTGYRIILVLMRTNAGGTDRIIAGFRQANDSTEANSNTFTKAWNLGTSELSGIVCLSVSDDFGYLNNSQISRDQYPIAHIPSSTTELGIQCWFSSTANDYRKYPGNMYCVRVYSKKLSRAEIAHNYKVDKKRFNIS